MNEWMEWMDTCMPPAKMLLPNTLNARGQKPAQFSNPLKIKIIYFENEMETKNSTTWHLDTKNSHIFAYANRSFLLLYSCRGPTLIRTISSFSFSCSIYVISSTISSSTTKNLLKSDKESKHRIEWKMVGLSVVLEAQKSCINKKTPQVINKTSMMLSSIHNKPSPQPSSLFQPPTFLDQCFLCGKRLLPGKDIYMYKWVLLLTKIKTYIYISIYIPFLLFLFIFYFRHIIYVYSIVCDPCNW